MTGSAPVPTRLFYRPQPSSVAAWESPAGPRDAKLSGLGMAGCARSRVEAERPGRPVSRHSLYPFP